MMQRRTCPSRPCDRAAAVKDLLCRRDSHDNQPLTFEPLFSAPGMKTGTKKKNISPLIECKNNPGPRSQSSSGPMQNNEETTDL